MKCIGLIAATALLLSACATPEGPDAQAARLALEKANLYWVLSQGCLPYVFGGESPEAAMKAAGLIENAFYRFTFPDPPPASDEHQYTGRYKGISAVNLRTGGCYIHGSDPTAPQAYAQAVDAAFRQRFGEGYADETIPPFKTDFPDQVRFCLRDHMVTYYPEPPYSVTGPGGLILTGFDIEISLSTPNCGRASAPVAAG